jgi:ABC-type dipeptide/oligopeptide/nickel transport system permease subunit
MIRNNPSMAIGAVLVAVLMLLAIVGPVAMRTNPFAIDLVHALGAPSRNHWLGCDSLGRDVLARIIWGARLSLGVSTIVVAFSLTIGGAIGGAAALAGGRIDGLVMRGVDIVMAFRVSCSRLRWPRSWGRDSWTWSSHSPQWAGLAMRD